MQPYDCNEHFTVSALKRLEWVANIPVLTDHAVEQKLSQLKSYAGFKVQSHYNPANSSFLQYMYSWLEGYKNKQCSVEPTWSKFLEALKLIDLTRWAERIEAYLKTAPVVVQAKPKEGEYRDSFV